MFKWLKQLFCEHLEVINTSTKVGKWRTANCKHCGKGIKLFRLL